MADDTKDAAAAGASAGRPKRAPPTIDLEATEVSTSAAPAGDGEPAAEAAAPPDDVTPNDDASTKPDAEPPPRARKTRLLPLPAVAALSGAATGALVVAAFWLFALPPRTAPITAAAPPQVSAAAFDALAARVASVETKPAPPPAVAADPRAAARIDAQDKIIAALREELGVLRAQTQQLTAATEALKAAPRDSAPAAPAAPAVDLSPINERLTQIEQTAKKLSSETAQRNAQPANDLALRRIVAASLLDTSVRQGEPYAALLAAAKPLAIDPATLTPLDAFAASGVPGVSVLSRELVAQVSKLAPQASASAAGEQGILDRLQAGAAKLVRIQRTDKASGNDRDAVVSRATAAALRNDVATARRELDALSPADRAAMQPWIDKADARSAALAASRQFAADAMAALAKPAQ